MLMVLPLLTLWILSSHSVMVVLEMLIRELLLCMLTRMTLVWAQVTLKQRASVQGMRGQDWLVELFKL